MATTVFPAMYIRPEQQQQPNMIGQLGQMLALRQAVQIQPLQLQTAQLQLQQEQMNVNSQNALMQAYTQAGGDPDQTLKLASQTGKVLPKDMLAFQQQQMAYKTGLANLTEKQLTTMQSQNGELRDAINPIFQLPDEQQVPAANRLLMQLHSMNPADRQLQYGLTDQQLAQIPPGAITNINQLKFFEATLAGHEKATEEQLKAATAEKTIAEIPGARAEAQMKQAHQFAYQTWAQQPGNEGKTIDEYESELKAHTAGAEAAARYPYEQKLAFLNKSLAMQNMLAEHAVNSINDAFISPQHGFSQTLATANAVKGNIAAAKDGDELAASLTPLMTALGVTSYAGTHRINQNEINAAGPQVGSLFREINTRLEKVAGGALDPDTARETGALMDRLLDSKYGLAVGAASVAARNGGVDPSQISVMDRSGNLTTLDKAQKDMRGAQLVSVSIPRAEQPPLHGTIRRDQIEKVKREHPNWKISE